MALNQYFRKLWVRTLVINLVAAGQTANDFMTIILEDISLGVTQEIECVKTECGRGVLFINPIGNIADFHALSALNDSMDHYYNKFCSFCLFPILYETATASIVYTMKMNLRRMSLMRFYARIDVSGSHGVLSEAVRKHVGLKSNTRGMTVSYFTEKLCHEIFRLSLEDRTNSSHTLLASSYDFDSFSARLQHQKTSSPVY